MTGSPQLVVALNAVIIAVTDEQPRVLTVSISPETHIEGGGGEGERASSMAEALPTGPLDPAGDRTLDLALRRWVRTQAGIELGYVEQLYTFGDRFRDQRERAGGPRIVSVAYVALVREDSSAQGLAASWRDVYRYFTWEDWRQGRPEIIERVLEPALLRWIDSADIAATRELRRERAGVAFGLFGGHWDGDRVLERYELLYELGIVAEAARDVDKHQKKLERPVLPVSGKEMAFDHRRILASAVGRIRAKIKYRPVIFELIPEEFTLLQLQRCVEALAGIRLHKQNFRRLVEKGGLVEGTGKVMTETGGRPAELFRFRREVLLERPAPGVGLRRIRC